jgi:hypothetical protein
MDAEAPDLPLAGSKNNEPKSRGHDGTRAGSGRNMGAPNKLTADVKAAIMAAFTDAGGKDYLVAVSKTDTRTFCMLLAKVLPKYNSSRLNVSSRLPRLDQTPQA